MYLFIFYTLSPLISDPSSQATFPGLSGEEGKMAATSCSSI